MKFCKNSLFSLFAAVKSGCMTKRIRVIVPYSKLNIEVLSKFYEKGLIANYSFDASLQILTVYLKFDAIGRGLLASLYWYSKPSRQVSIKASELKLLDTSFYFLIFNENGLFFSDDLLELRRGGILLCKFLR